MNSALVITGGAGFIGSALAAHRLGLGDEQVVVVDQLGDGPEDAERWKNLSGLPLADYWDKQEFLARVERGRGLPPIRALVHLGACSSTTEADAGFLMRNNFAYTRALALWALRRGVRFVYASSAATYGDGSRGYDDTLEALEALRPLNAYGFSKHAFDLWAWRHGAFDAIAGLKYFNVFGPNEYHKGAMRSMALKAFEQIEAGGCVRLFRSERPGIANGEQSRDFIYIADAVAMTSWIVDEPSAVGLFNIGSGRARTWNDLAKGIFAALGRAPEIEYIPMPTEIRAAYQYHTTARMDRWRRFGGPAPAWSLEDALRDYVTNYLVPGRRRLQPAPFAQRDRMKATI